MVRNAMRKPAECSLVPLRSSNAHTTLVILERVVAKAVDYNLRIGFAVTHYRSANTINYLARVTVKGILSHVDNATAVYMTC